MTARGFAYSDAVVERFPSIRARVIVADGFDNRSVSPGLSDEFGAAQRFAIDQGSPPADMPSIRAWRSVFSDFGVKPTKHRNAAESLLRRLQRFGELPSINAAVDIGNLVSITHALPVAVFDLAEIAGALSVEFAEGTESFVGIGQSEPEPPERGEVVFIDDAGAVAARRWCWKQSGQSATKPSTEAVMFVLEATHEQAEAAVAAAGEHLETVLARHQPVVELTSAALSPTRQRALFRPPTP